MVHVHEVTYMLLDCAAFVVHELILLLLRSSWFMCMRRQTCCYAVYSSSMDVVQRFHLRRCTGTRQWQAQPTVDLRSISMCMAKEECRQEFVPAFGHGTEKWRMTVIVDEKSFGHGRTHFPLQIAVKPCSWRCLHGISWPFSNYRCS